jgi:hypothetical protein
MDTHVVLHRLTVNFSCSVMCSALACGITLYHSIISLVGDYHQVHVVVMQSMCTASCTVVLTRCHLMCYMYMMCITGGGDTRIRPRQLHERATSAWIWSDWLYHWAQERLSCSSYYAVLCSSSAEDAAAQWSNGISSSSSKISAKHKTILQCVSCALVHTQAACLYIMIIEQQL